MEFDYSTYYRADCIVPLSLFLFCGALFVYSFVSILKGEPITNLPDRFGIVLLPLVACFLMIINAAHLSRGGLHLLFERESDQVQIEGIIEETIEIGSLGGSKYGAKYNNHGRGEAIIVNGEEYFLISYGELKVDDPIRLSVLPKSHFVLSLYKSDETTGTVNESENHDSEG